MIRKLRKRIKPAVEKARAVASRYARFVWRRLGREVQGVKPPDASQEDRRP